MDVVVRAVQAGHRWTAALVARRMPVQPQTDSKRKAKVRLMKVQKQSATSNLLFHLTIRRETVLKSRTVFWLIAGFGLLVTCAPNVSCGQRQTNLAQSRDAQKNGWRFDFAAAREEASKSKKPIMAVLRCVP